MSALSDPDNVGFVLVDEPESTRARARLLELADQIQRKFNPGQLRDDDGKWTDGPGGAASSAAKDLLELAGRIDLDPRETLISSDRLKGDNGGDADLNWAVVHSPAGNEVRLGVIPHFDSDKWRAGDLGGTAVLDAGQVATFRDDLRGAVAEARKALKEADERFGPDDGLPENPTDRDKILFGMDPVVRGVVANDWADLHWNVYLTDQEDEPWLLSLEAGDPDTNQADPVQFAPKNVGKLLTALGRIESDLAETSRSRRGLSRSYAADGGGTGQTNATATKTTGERKGGQFAPGGGRVGGKGKQPAKRPAKKAPAKPAGPMGWDGKNGTGYGIKGGDARVRTLQSILNRLGLKDSSGEPLVIDGKFGPRTTSAVKRLQKAMGLPADGKVTEDFIKRVAGAKTLEELRPPKPAKPTTRPARKRVRRSADHFHELDNGICRTCTPTPGHVFDNGVCVTCGDVDPKGEASCGTSHVLANGVCVTCGYDEAVRALIDAIDEIFRTRYVRTPAGSRRYGLPIGSPIGGGGAHVPQVVKLAKAGRTTLKDRIVSAIEAHLDGKGDGKPLEGFSREQLRQVAKAHGIPLRRGEDKDSIAAKLLDHAGGPRPAAAKKVAGKAMPVPDRAKPYHRNLDGIEDLAAAVEDGKPLRKRVSLTGGVSAETELHTLKDGTRVVYKYGGNPDAEHAASMIGRALGLDAPRVYRDQKNAVYMDYVDDAKTWDQIRNAAGESPGGDLASRYKAARNSDDAKLIGLLDLMIVNGDRNNGNWMTDDSGRIVPIDHGHAFWPQYVGLPGRTLRAHAIDGTFSGAYLSDYRRWGPNDLTADDVAEIRSRLERLRPDFEHIGRERWLNYSLAVLDAVEPWALGNRNLVAGVR